MPPRFFTARMSLPPASATRTGLPFASTEFGLDSMFCRAAASGLFATSKAWKSATDLRP